jgi:hypothetical protein
MSLPDPVPNDELDEGLKEAGERLEVEHFKLIQTKLLAYHAYHTLLNRATALNKILTSICKIFDISGESELEPEKIDFDKQVLQKPIDKRHKLLGKYFLQDAALIARDFANTMLPLHNEIKLKIRDKMNKLYDLLEIDEVKRCGRVQYAQESWDTKMAEIGGTLKTKGNVERAIEDLNDLRRETHNLVSYAINKYEETRRVAEEWLASNRKAVQHAGNEKKRDKLAREEFAKGLVLLQRSTRGAVEFEMQLEEVKQWSRYTGTSAARAIADIIVKEDLFDPEDLEELEEDL